jgi:glycosyltransferase involved in cell wall biosynthesis
MTKPSLLFLSPVMPSPAGNGLAMRQAMFLHVLAESFLVHLHVVRLFPPAADPGAMSWIESSCASVTVQEVEDVQDPQFRMITQLRDESHRMAALGGYRQPMLMSYATPAAVEEAARRQTGRSFDAVHVGRLYLAPFAQPFRRSGNGQRTWTALDLDDYESAAHHRLAALHQARGEPAAAWLEDKEGAKYALYEEAELPKFDRVYLASDLDRQALQQRLPQASLTYMPNAVAVPPRPRRRSDNVFRLLFVGSMGYLPNDDAALWFIADVLPLLRAQTDRPVALTIVGSSPSPRLCALAESENVVVTGRVAELAPYYREADVALAPLRAGGGTRIKILEAFAHRCPVVSTALGAEGIGCNNGEHLLIAEDAEGIATACLRLLREPELGRRLAARALLLLHRDYSLAAIRNRIKAVITAPGSDPPRTRPRAGALSRHPK